MFANGLLYALFLSNAILAVFNMIPAFPMDGGRVLRALLGLVASESTATVIAGTIGQLMAIALAYFAIFGGAQANPLLLLVAIFVYMGAGQEMTAIHTRRFLEGHVVREAMQTRFRTIPHGESMQTAAEMLLAGSQHDFPVMAGQDLLGILTRTEIARGLATEGPQGYVAAHMNRDISIVSPGQPLEEAIEQFTDEGSTPLLVMDGDELVGMLTKENLSEFIMLTHALRNSRSQMTR
jgi:CBS domain-containing protein